MTGRVFESPSPAKATPYILTRSDVTLLILTARMLLTDAPYVNDHLIDMAGKIACLLLPATNAKTRAEVNHTGRNF